jgi:hypothetical protein
VSGSTEVVRVSGSTVWRAVQLVCVCGCSLNEYRFMEETCVDFSYVLLLHAEHNHVWVEICAYRTPKGVVDVCGLKISNFG